jgi:peptide/nickel transport system substrate-binding protein/oligopeptide transport system substrate-binding protein
MKQVLAELGVRVSVRYNTDWPAYVRALETYKLPLYRYTWHADLPDPDDFLYNLFHSKGQRNYMDYRNPQVDELLTEARRERAIERRMALYRTAEQIILNDAPLIPLSHYVYHRVLQPMRKVWLERK